MHVSVSNAEQPILSLRNMLRQEVNADTVLCAVNLHRTSLPTAFCQDAVTIVPYSPPLYRVSESKSMLVTVINTRISPARRQHERLSIINADPSALSRMLSQSHCHRHPHHDSTWYNLNYKCRRASRRAPQGNETIDTNVVNRDVRKRFVSFAFQLCNSFSFFSVLSVQIV